MLSTAGPQSPPSHPAVVKRFINPTTIVLWAKSLLATAQRTADNVQGLLLLDWLSRQFGMLVAIAIRLLRDDDESASIAIRRKHHLLHSSTLPRTKQRPIRHRNAWAAASLDGPTAATATNDVAEFEVKISAKTSQKDFSNV